MRRSMLFVPGNNPKMMVNCGFLGADAIIFDLEDAVSPEEKDAARLLVKYAISNLELCGCEVIVRVNAVDTPLFAEDLAAILPQRPALIMLPKTASMADIQLCDAAIAAHEIRYIFWAYPLTWFLSSAIYLVYYLCSDWVHGFSQDQPAVKAE